MIRGISYKLLCMLLGYLVFGYTYSIASDRGNIPEKSGISVVLAWLPLSDAWWNESPNADEQVTKSMTHLLNGNDDFDFVSLQDTSKQDFFTLLENLLLTSLRSPALKTHARQTVILIVSGSTPEQFNAVTQAKKLAALTHLVPVFLDHKAKLYGVVIGDVPYVPFLLKLAAACNLDTTSTHPYWFAADSPGQLTNAYARILLETRIPSAEIQYPKGLSTVRIMLAVGIVAMTLAGMGWLTHTVLPPEYRAVLLNRWWKKTEETVLQDEDDLISEVDTVILGTVPEADDE